MIGGLSWIVNLWGKEPVIITGLVDAVAVLLVSLNVPVSREQVIAVDGLIVAIGVLIARSQVTPPANLPAAGS